MQEREIAAEEERKRIASEKKKALEEEARLEAERKMAMASEEDQPDDDNHENEAIDVECDEDEFNARRQKVEADQKKRILEHNRIVEETYKNGIILCECRIILR